LSRQLVDSGASRADAPKLAYGLLYRSVGGQAQTLAYIDTFMVLAITAGIMFLLSFIVRKNDPKAGGGVAVG
jgi:DHA2 family multidrug resistance protein